MERRKREHVDLHAKYPSAVKRLYGLLQFGLRNLTAIPGQFYADLQTGFPQTWEALMNNVNTYSAPSCSSCSTTAFATASSVPTLTSSW